MLGCVVKNRVTLHIAYHLRLREGAMKSSLSVEDVRVRLVDCTDDVDGNMRRSMMMKESVA